MASAPLQSRHSRVQFGSNWRAPQGPVIAPLLLAILFNEEKILLLASLRAFCEEHGYSLPLRILTDKMMLFDVT